MSARPIVGTCDTCHKGPQPVRVSGDLPMGPHDDVLMDRFICESCGGEPVRKFDVPLTFHSTIRGAVEQSKIEILNDIEQGFVPSTVKTFSELHDFVDANCYGGLCDDDCTLSMEQSNDVQNVVNVWLQNGRK